MNAIAPAAALSNAMVKFDEKEWVPLSANATLFPAPASSTLIAVTNAAVAESVDNPFPVAPAALMPVHIPEAKAKA